MAYDVGATIYINTKKKIMDNIWVHNISVESNYQLNSFKWIFIK